MSQLSDEAASNLPGLFVKSQPRPNSEQGQAQAANPPSYPSSSPQTQIYNPHQSDVMSPSAEPEFKFSHSQNTSRNTTPARASVPPSTQPSSAQMTNPLLNLLKFGSNASSPQGASQQQTSRPRYGSPNTHSVHGRGISASDLVASFTGGKSSTPTPRDKSSSATSTNHQDALLRLLNQAAARPEGTQLSGPGSTEARPKQSSEDNAGSLVENQHPSVTDIKTSVSGRNESPIRTFGSNDETAPTPFEPQVSPHPETSQKNKPIFTYVNPFEQLAASSPRHLKPRSSMNGDLQKRKIKSPSPAALHSSSRRKLTPSGSEVLQSIETPDPEHLEDGRSQIEALMGIGAPSRDAETVAQALNEVGGQVDRQVESALAKAEEQVQEKSVEPEIKQEEIQDIDQETLNAIEEKVQEVAVDVKKELEKDENQGLLEKSMPASVADAVKEVIDDVADGTANTKDSVSAAVQQATSPKVLIYQFPMKPFVSIDLIQKDPTELHFREEAIINVARFKKDFDQADRILATASNEFIVYAMPKNAGIRIIEQDNGNSHLIYNKSQDRIFNVSVSTAPSTSSQHGTQTLIATGVSGTVYWSTISMLGEELSQEDMERQGFVVPPIGSQPDLTSAGQLKTRAKKSNRHPEYFAIGRGKSIQIIFSVHAQQRSELITKDGIMDTEKYYSARNLKIATGKAGKDFIFSEDDTTIITLDKTGKLRIWDIQELTNEDNASASMLTPVEVKTPLLTFSTAQASEKSWPTSVLSVDKLRPYEKGIALRYIIVGLKQNHTLQLWDLCLGKAVQELNFPHDKETDPICSVAYHPGSGIIVVGHPTRNSIYFIHLSAPKYNLPGFMSQAKLVQRLASKDSTLPKTEATAIMSGMREYSFASMGQIRSVDLLPSSGESTRSTAEDQEDPTLFELYVMHSKGVVCLNIKRGDLGWTKDGGKGEGSVDAEKEGHIIVKPFRESSALSASEPSSNSVNGDASTATASAKPKIPVKESIKPSQVEPDIEKAAPTTSDKAEKKKNKKNASNQTVARTPAALAVPASHAGAAQASSTPVLQPTSTPKGTPRQNKVKTVPPDVSEPAPASTEDQPVHPLANSESVSVGISGDFLDKELKKIERGVSNEFNKVITRELETLYRRFADDKRVQDAAGAAKQDAMLRLVSSTLSDNVEKSLSRIILKSINDSVVPSITNITSTAVNQKLSTEIPKQVQNSMDHIMKYALPDAIGRTIQTPKVLQTLSDQVGKALTKHIEKEFSTTLHNQIVPRFTDLAVSVAQKVSADTESRVREQLQKAEIQHRDDSNKIGQLTSLVRGLSETVHTMAAAQSDFQLEILKLQQKAAQENEASARHQSPTPSDSASMQISPEQEEFDSIVTAMNENRYEEATVIWLQSTRQIDLFDSWFVRCSPRYLNQASPLVVLSVGAAVTASLETNVMDRLNWLETVFNIIDPRNPDIQDVASRILDVLVQRLEGEYMRISEDNPRNPALRRISGLVKQARELKAYGRWVDS